MKNTIIIAGLILLIGGGAAFVFLRLNNKNSSSSSRPATILGDSSKTLATVNIDKSFEFNAINQNKAKKKVKFTIYGVDRKDEIRVKGETRKAPSKYDFLLVRVEIENKHTERLAIAPSDLIRYEDEKQKLFAPDYHNGNVLLDPISVKKDLLSFVVAEGQKKFTLLVGELDGEKQKVEVNF